MQGIYFYHSRFSPDYPSCTASSVPPICLTSKSQEFLEIIETELFFVSCNCFQKLGNTLEVTFSNSLIINERKSQWRRRFGHPILISVDFDDFTSLFTQ